MKRILIIEDDPGIKDALITLFNDMNYVVDIYSDGQIVFTEEFIIPDIFIIDKQLSGIDGLDLCRHLKTKENTKHIPVIMLSASPSITPLAKGAGAEDAIEKPFTLQVIKEKISKYLA
jgi:DNA-binding response OmpR family regulator